jgi:hypothetical protein
MVSFARKCLKGLLVSLTTLLLHHSALALEGSGVDASVGVWAPFLPAFNSPALSDSQDEFGSIVGLRTYHRFQGYRTNVEAGINFGHTSNIQMLNYEAGLRDTWDTRYGGLSAGLLFSGINFDQDIGASQIDSDLIGAKIVGGWETVVGRTPLWIDLGLGLYDLNANYTGAAPPQQATLSEFTTTYSIAARTKHCCMGVPVSPMIGVEYFSDMPQWY